MALFKKVSTIESSPEFNVNESNKKYLPQITTYYVFGIPVYKRDINIIYYDAHKCVFNEGRLHFIR